VDEDCELESTSTVLGLGGAGAGATRFDRYRLGHLSDLSGRVCLLVLEHDVPVDLQAGSFAFYNIKF
jgi:hypothetical protein